MDRLQDTEERLYHFVRQRIDYEKETEKTRNLVQKQNEIMMQVKSGETVAPKPPESRGDISDNDVIS